MACQKCKSDRVLSFGCKCSDMSNWSMGSKEGDGYVLSDIGIGGGDYVRFEYCLDCGQIQGKFPLPKSEADAGHTEEDEESCEFCGSTKNVSYGTDPYAQDIDGDDTEHHICATCHNERAADI